MSENPFFEFRWKSRNFRPHAGHREPPELYARSRRNRSCSIRAQHCAIASLLNRAWKPLSYASKLEV
uniref:Uncharacterized protein n=1 Tax=Strigamia maritima TaxID=126957 RepID=T1IGR4_STRMM